jgi:preprotein translocase subunit SecD
MAVDANVLIFERIREELAHGKSVRLAVDEGFKHAMSAIVDSNITTVLTAFILYIVGTGPVQGFAVTLIIGIAASMLSAVFVTRTLFLIWLQRRPAMTTLSVG